MKEIMPEIALEIIHRNVPYTIRIVDKRKWYITTSELIFPVGFDTKEEAEKYIENLRMIYKKNT